MQMGKLDEAATELKKAVTLRPDNGSAWAILGSTLKQAGHLDESRAALEKAIPLQPGQPGPLVTLAGVLGESLMMLLVVAAWAGAWALVGRVTQHRFRFPEHFAIACLAMSGFIASAGAFEYLSFFFPGGFGWDVLAGAAALAIGVVGLAAHLARVSTMSHWPRLLWSLGVIGGLAGIVALSGHRDQVDYTGRFEATPLKGVAARWIPTVRPGEFLKQVDGLKEEVDRLADEAPVDEEEQLPEPDSTED
jgi:hypothetical protein